jgi:EAL domain-containing protein (putative c-di-GMP-specific phosphodiesterase class I)
VTASAPLFSTSAPEWSAWIERAIAGDGVRAVFQPIVDLRRRVVVGYEALTRFTADGCHVGPPDQWFLHAHEMGVGPQLEVRALETILAHRADLPKNCFLSLNVDPNYLVEPTVRDVFADAGDLTGLVIELTEHHRWYWDAFEPTLRFLRLNGAQLAIDDTGAGYSGLQQILLLRPAILKLDRSLIEGIDGDEARVALVEMISVFAGRIDAAVLAEGVETLGEAQRLVELRVPLAQGFLFGRPEPPWSDIEPGVEARLERFASVSHGQLHRLIDPVAALPRGARAELRLDAEDSWRAVIDEHQRPIGVVDAHGMATGQVLDTLVVDVHATPQEMARRLAIASLEPNAPIVVTDERGHYLGLITLRRLLAELGG